MRPKETMYAHVVTIAGEMLSKRSLHACPRVGETLRFGGPGMERYYTVVEVCWCMDEDRPDGLQRVNIGVTPQPQEQSRE